MAAEDAVRAREEGAPDGAFIPASELILASSVKRPLSQRVGILDIERIIEREQYLLHLLSAGKQ